MDESDGNRDDILIREWNSPILGDTSQNKIQTNQLKESDDSRDEILIYEGDGLNPSDTSQSEVLANQLEEFSDSRDNILVNDTDGLIPSDTIQYEVHTNQLEKFEDSGDSILINETDGLIPSGTSQNEVQASQLVESDDSIDDILINEWDGLNLDDISEEDSTASMSLESEVNNDFAASNTAAPNSVIIVTNLVEAAFGPSDAQTEFERLFQRHDKKVQFQYLKSFRRVRVVFSSIEAAKKAHAKVNNSEIHGQPFRCYFAEPIGVSSDVAGNRRLLELPPPQKQFLLSPPPSPPPGWVMINERKPAINYELIDAMARLGPEKSYELHTGQGNQPSIIVHVCDDPEGFANRPSKIPQTRRPD